MRNAVISTIIVEFTRGSNPRRGTKRKNRGTMRVPRFSCIYAA
nr:MAG TPA: hypothetical protein [Caudoviricetes sp.]